MNAADEDTNSLTIPADDIVRLIEAHLTEAGFHQTVKCLQKESGVGLAGLPQSNFGFHASSGQWAAVLRSLAMIDRQRARLSNDLIAETHEMAILELADEGDLPVAYATYRLVQKELEEAMVYDDATKQEMSRSRLLELKLASLASSRAKDPKAAAPKDFYGATGKQDRREDLGRRLQEAVPQQPKHRLVSLLQQAIKWQTYTGESPRVRQWWDEEGEPSKPKRKRKVFDLVLGEAHVDEIPVGGPLPHDTPLEPIPSDPYAVVKFGKNATAESAVFLPDASGLVTGSSDGLIEVWDPAQKFSELRMDLPYQQKEELLGHDSAVTAMAVSNDGTMLASGSIGGELKVWRLDTGKCLRKIDAHSRSTVSCLAFSPDGSQVLTGAHDGTSREFGLRTAKMLKEFTGHSSYVSCCAYSTGTSKPLVVTGSGDGTVRLFDRKSLDVLRIFRPVSLGVASSLSAAGSSILTDPKSTTAADGGSPAIHSVIQLHTPASTMILVPRGYRAFLVNYVGAVLRVFQDDGATSDKVFVAATVSSTNQWLYAVKEDGMCCVFNVENGQLERSIRDFGAESTRMPKDSSSVAEISSILHHPNKSILAAFSNDKGQRKGQLVLWK